MNWKVISMIGLVVLSSFGLGHLATDVSYKAQIRPVLIEAYRLGYKKGLQDCKPEYQL